MRTRPDAQQEVLARRLALIRAEEPAERSVAGSEDDWWAGHTVVAGWSQDEDAGEDADEDDEPPPRLGAVSVPDPGRHAARRSRRPAPALPEVLQGRARLGTAQLAVVALVLAAALALTCWWLARGRATVLAPVSAPTTPAGTAAPLVPMATPVGASAAAPAVAGSDGAVVTVDVEGRVRRPGIVVLAVGSRVTDALHAAGGVPHRRALDGLNLAAVLVDGQQIVVGGASTSGASGGPVSATGTGATPVSGAGPLVDLNTATAEELDTLPDVGPVTAQSILEWREQNGGFTSVQELLEVDGIGPATLAKLIPHVTV